MRTKPKQERYYKNLKTGQYASLEGSPLAIKDIETRQWKRQKVTCKRIPRREFRANVPWPHFSHHYPGYYPNVARKGRSEIRKGHICKGHEVNFAYFPYS